MNNSILGSQTNLLSDMALEQQYTQNILNQTQSAETANAVKAARAFESYFLNIMVKEMRKTIQHSELFPRSQGEEMFEEMLDEQYCENIAEKGNLGLSQMILEHMRVKHKGEG